MYSGREDDLGPTRNSEVEIAQSRQDANAVQGMPTDPNKLHGGLSEEFFAPSRLGARHRGSPLGGVESALRSWGVRAPPFS